VIKELIKAPPLGEARDRELLKDAQSYLYHQTPHGDLACHFFFPWEHSAEAKAPVMVFFHGGLWDASLPTQFVPHALHFATRGAVTLTVAYRVSKIHHTSPIEAMEDAASVAVFLRNNAHLLGIDPERMIFVGAGSGGHLALCCATLPNISSHSQEIYQPQAVILFSALVDTTDRGLGAARFPDPKIATKLSPTKNIKKGQPPVLIFHGTHDRVVPFEQVAKFSKKYHRKNEGDLVPFERAGHTFFNFNTNPQTYEMTLRAADHFLVDLELLEPDPLAGEFI
jgi:acetyl esterase